MSNLHRAGARRVVTFVDADGRSRMNTDHAASRVVDFEETPGLRASVLWSTADVPVLGGEPADPAPKLSSVHPAPGGSVFMTLTVPPDSVYASAEFNPAKAVAEQMRSMPGIVERMEPDAPGFHRTETLDYVILLAGDLWLVVDEQEVQLNPGDTVVQVGARHAWQNRSSSPATIAVVLMGAQIKKRKKGFFGN